MRGILGRSAQRSARGLLRVLMLGFCEALKRDHKDKRARIRETKTQEKEKKQKKGKLRGWRGQDGVCGDHLR
jgi:hypothetical protein